MHVHAPSKYTITFLHKFFNFQHDDIMNMFDIEDLEQGSEWIAVAV